MHSRTRQVFALVALGMLAAAGCNPTYAPPVRSTHFGAPGRLGPRQGAVYATAGVPGRARGSLGLSVPISSAVRLEAQGDGSEAFAMGSGGVRVVHRGEVLSMDGEAGLGMGAGGERCGNNTDSNVTCSGAEAPGSLPPLRPDGRDAWSRLAYGGYAGVGLGVRVRTWLELYGRGMIQLTTTTGVPTTLWASAMGGAQFTTGPIDLHVALGYAGFFNERDQTSGLNIEAGVSVPFGPR